jgi:hypothetical protein
MIFIASPYTHPDYSVRQRRYKRVQEYTHRCMQLGEVVFSPIVYGHVFVQYDERAITSDYWKDFNDHMLMASTSMRVYCLPGWDTSAGVDAEIAYAYRLTIPMEYVTPTEVVTFEELPHEDI